MSFPSTVRIPRKAGVAGATRMPGADSGGRATGRAKNVAASGSPNLSRERRRAIALRVEIEKENALAMLGKIPGEVDGDRALADAALLVVHDDHFHEAEVLFGLGHDRFDVGLRIVAAEKTNLTALARLGNFSGVE